MTVDFDTCLRDLTSHAAGKVTGDWVFRGQRDAAWTLLPAVGRGDIWGSNSYSHQREVDLFTRFNEVLHGRVVGRYTDFERLAIGQHYGLPSRLLDWTTNIYTAAYFASQAPDQGPEIDGKIWMVSVPDDKMQFFWRHPFETPGLSKPVFVRVPPFEPRMAQQDGLFSLHPDPQSAWTIDPTDYRTDTYIVPAAAKPELRKYLASIGFNNGRLLRDLDAACARLAGWLKST